MFLVFLIAFFSIKSPVFLTLENATNILRQISIISISAVGMSMVLLTGGTDLSIGSSMALCSVLLAKLLVSGISVPIAILITLFFGALIGLFNGLCVNLINISPMITTLGTSTIFRGLTYTITNGMPIHGFPKGFSFIGQGYIGILPVPVIIAICNFIIGIFILEKTKLGRYIYGVGGNEDASYLSGVPVKNIKYKVFMISGIMSAVAGIVLLSRINSALPNAGQGFEFDVITSVVLGGISTKGGEGKLQGVIVGILIMGILANGMILLSINEYYQMIIKGFALLIAVGVDSSLKR